MAAGRVHQGVWGVGGQAWGTLPLDPGPQDRHSKPFGPMEGPAATRPARRDRHIHRARLPRREGKAAEPPPAV
jgi:hypothetical protein